MKQKSPTSLPADEFFGRYAEPMKRAFACQSPYVNLKTLLDGTHPVDPPFWNIASADPIEAARQWLPVSLLRRASKEGDAEACKRVLFHFLLELDIRIPKGVLLPFKWKHGRPDETRAIYQAWMAQGQPALTWRVCEKLARVFYPQEFAAAKSDSVLRKRLRDRVRATMGRQVRRRRNSQ